MPEQEQYVIEELFFLRCQHWSTEQCPNLHSSQMQLSIANAPHWFMLNDLTVDMLAEMCKRCADFKQIDKTEQPMR